MKISGKKILAIIPARGGSKSIPKKNIFPIAGKPLLAWTIKSALKSKLIGRVVVSSDDKEILEATLKFGAEPIRRPKNISGDKSLFKLLIFHALDYLKKNEKYIPDIIVYLQPTSPLRESKDIDKALSLLKGDTQSVISVYEIDNKILKSFFVDKRGIMKGISNNEFPFMNRQLLPKAYMPNGSIYAIRTKSFLKNGNFFNKKTVAYLMTGEKSIDVDSIEDMKKAEKILRDKKIGFN